MLSLYILLQGENPGGLSSLLSGPFLFFIIILIIFYFFMVRPQQKRQKEEQQFRDTVEKGDRVTTIGGIHGRVASVEDTSVLLEVDTNVKLRFEKSSLRPLPEVKADKKA